MVQFTWLFLIFLGIFLGHLTFDTEERFEYGESFDGQSFFIILGSLIPPVMLMIIGVTWSMRFGKFLRKVFLKQK